MKECYFDNAATTKVDIDIANQLVTLMTEEYGNPSSLHKKGLSAQLILDEARATLAKSLGCTAQEVYFCSSATESVNLALFGAMRARKRRLDKLIVVSSEHSCVLEAADELEKEGFEVVRVSPNSDGSIDHTALAALVDEKTALVSCMLVNNETGVIADIAALTKQIKIKNPQTLVHCDAVAAFGKLPFSTGKLGVDLLSVTAHKIYGPKGIGALFIKRGVRILPLLFGGGQQQGIRPGTETPALAFAFAMAAEKAVEQLPEHLAHAQKLHDYLIDQVKNIQGICMNSPANATPYIINLSVLGIRSEIMMHFLEEENIYLSSGSACSGSAKSHVLLSMGLEQKRIDSALRISFGKYNDLEQLDCLIGRLILGKDTLMRSR